MVDLTWKSEFDYSDLTPVNISEQPNALAEILYSDAYKESMGYMLALMAKSEYSARALAVVKSVIEQNPGHYTAWHYRLEILKHKGKEIIPKEKWLLYASEPEYEEEDEEDKETKEEEDDPVVKELKSKSESSLVIVEDYQWLNNMTMNHAKNYQVWHYRQQLIPMTCAPEGSSSDAIGTQLFALHFYYQLERLIIEMIFSEDAKNYHAWSHLVWLMSWDSINIVTNIKSLFGSDDDEDDDEEDEEEEELDTGYHVSPINVQTGQLDIGASGEIDFIENLLYMDVYNNSAWSYRHFIIQKLLAQEPEELQAKLRLHEFLFLKFSIAKAPQNESPWNYARSIFDLTDKNLRAQNLDYLTVLIEDYVPFELTNTAMPTTAVSKENEEIEEIIESNSTEIILKSTHALELFVYMNSVTIEDSKEPEKQAHLVKTALDLLTKYVPIRKSYWSFLQSQFDSKINNNDDDSSGLNNSLKNLEIKA